MNDFEALAAGFEQIVSELKNRIDNETKARRELEHKIRILEMRVQVNSDGYSRSYVGPRPFQ